MAWTRFSQGEVDGLFAALRARDPFGHRVHTMFACAACFFAGWPTTWLEMGCIGVFLCCGVRLFSHHRILGPLVWEWPLRLMLLWLAWSGLSLAWTAGTRQEWLEEWGVIRYALLIPALWPVMNERRWLVAALAAGALCGNLSQVAHTLGRAAEIDWLTWSRFDDRNSGWWDPVVGGSVLCAALGLHLAALALGRSARERALGGVLAAATLVGIAATGTRGAWIGAAGLVAFALLLGTGSTLVGRRESADPNARGTLKVTSARLAIGALAVLFCAGAVWVAAGPTIISRVRETRAEMDRAMRGDLDTFTGQRLAMWGWSWRAVREHPIRGIGAGGFRAWVDERSTADARERNEPVPKPMLHGHAHSWFIHAAAATGVTGFGLMLALAATCAWNGLREGGPAGGRAKWSAGYDAGPAFALVGLAAAGLFDTIHVNQQTSFWLWLLVALCMRHRPAMRGTPGAPP
ncbi:MAG: O-antigen ligase family protein [Phycisphaeraceae bacterium]|nr:O-antigen ligase family protein [Phycisphaeraceae bacterium]